MNGIQCFFGNIRKIFCCRNHSGNRTWIFIFQMFSFSVQNITNWKVGFLNQIINHSLQSHGTTVIRRINSSDSILVQFLDFFGKYHSTATTKYFDMFCSFFLQQIIHIFEIFVVSPLVGSHRNCISIFLNGGVHNFFYTSIMTQMNDLNSGCLNNSTHDINSGIMTVKK